MALSMPPTQNSWDRTLPNPALLPNGVEARRSSSLLQHHISSNQFLTPAADDSGRRNTLPCLPRHEERDIPEEDTVRQRQVSVVSSQSATESSEGTSPTDNSGLCLCVPEPKIPRPRNAFILYRQHQHSAVVAQNPGLPNPDISKIIGEQWRHLSVKEKGEWQALAEQEKARHSQQFPDYRYRPKRSGRFQSTENNSTTASSSSCTKCGGKTMNPPNTPLYAQYEGHHPVVNIARPAKRPYPGAPIQPPRGSVVTIAPQQSPGPVRYASGPPPPHQRHDSIQYVRGPPPPPSHYMAGDGAEAKRRRIDSVYGPRPSYDHTYYERERAPALFHPDQGPRHAMPPPAHMSIIGPQKSPATPTRPIMTGQGRRDPSLTLPPLKTAPPARPIASPKPQIATSKSSVEAMIMSYPVLTKLKTLHSITPVTSNNGPGSRSNRGTVIAIEGLDAQYVMDMTHSLADQLEKEGNFAVKIFNGPDPYQALHGRRASMASSEDMMTTGKYLNIITQWHQASKDVQDFIATSQPSTISPEDHEMTDAGKNEVKDTSPFDRPQIENSPISAVSPRTTSTALQPCGTSHKSNQSRNPSPSHGTHPTPQPDLRIPEGSSSRSTSPDMTSECTAEVDCNRKLIPVAIVPHYQLTTVDACSIALPITDNYDPLTHWRWHATLWRGCVGPDISIVIKTAQDQHEDDTLADQKRLGQSDGRRMSTVAGNARPDTAPSGVPPISAIQTTAPPLALFGVEVRLNDHRAVIVRAGHSSRVNGVDPREIEKEIENWEKAKRRVGFEVEESLRR